MKILLVILISGSGGTPFLVPVDVFPSVKACEARGLQIVALTRAMSAPADADFLCLQEVPA